jgi:hypothetical protein
MLAFGVLEGRLMIVGLVVCALYLLLLNTSWSNHLKAIQLKRATFFMLAFWTYLAFEAVQFLILKS